MMNIAVLIILYSLGVALAAVAAGAVLLLGRLADELARQRRRPAGSPPDRPFAELGRAVAQLRDALGVRDDDGRAP